MNATVSRRTVSQSPIIRREDTELPFWTAVSDCYALASGRFADML